MNLTAWMLMHGLFVVRFVAIGGEFFVMKKNRLGKFLVAIVAGADPIDGAIRDAFAL